MEKRNKIIYWIVTIFLSIGMLAGGTQQMLQIGGYNEIVTSLGYPLYTFKYTLEYGKFWELLLYSFRNFRY